VRLRGRGARGRAGAFRRATADPAHPPTAASRARARVYEPRAAGDYPRCASAQRHFVYEDRRKRALLGGDADVWVERQVLCRPPGRQ
jgi:hypothetical protein